MRLCQWICLGSFEYVSIVQVCNRRSSLLVARILYDETNVLLLRKFDPGGNVLRASYFDRVRNIVAKQARRCLWCEGITAGVLLPWIHDGGWRPLANPRIRD